MSVLSPTAPPRAGDAIAFRFYSKLPCKTSEEKTQRVQEIQKEFDALTTDYLFECGGELAVVETTSDEAGGAISSRVPRHGRNPRDDAFAIEPDTEDPLENSVSLCSGRCRLLESMVDEWFVTFVVVSVTRKFTDVVAQVWNEDDGQYLLIEAARLLPRWLEPNTSARKVFIYQGNLHILPQSLEMSTPLDELLLALGDSTAASSAIQSAAFLKMTDYPRHAREESSHYVVVELPIKLARLIERSPGTLPLVLCLLSRRLHPEEVESSSDEEEEDEDVAGEEEKLPPLTGRSSRQSSQNNHSSGEVSRRCSEDPASDPIVRTRLRFTRLAYMRALRMGKQPPYAHHPSLSTRAQKFGRMIQDGLEAFLKGSKSFPPVEDVRGLSEALALEMDESEPLALDADKFELVSEVPRAASRFADDSDVWTSSSANSFIQGMEQQLATPKKPTFSSDAFLAILQGQGMNAVAAMKETEELNQMFHDADLNESE